MDVLVVDDDAEIRQLLGYVMELRGWDVRVATSAEEALLALATKRPDLLLLDLSLPRRDGVGLLRLLDRGLGRPRHIVLVSALPERIVETIAADHDVPYLTKPFALTDLDAVLSEHVGAGSGATG